MGDVMPKFYRPSEEDRAIGLALAERAKLDPSVVLEDYSVDSHGDIVSIRFEVLHQMPRAEFEALIAKYRPQP